MAEQAPTIPDAAVGALALALVLHPLLDDHVCSPYLVLPADQHLDVCTCGQPRDAVRAVLTAALPHLTEGARSG